MNQVQSLTSFKNPKLQFVRELLRDRKAREETGFFVVEGVRLAEEALSHSLILPHMVVTSPNLSVRGKTLLQQKVMGSTELIEIPEDVMDRLSDTETAQGVLLVLPQKIEPLPQHSNLVVILDQVRDPGNMGTILRSAAAAGVGAVFTAPGSVDPFNPKVVRAGMGAHFHMPIIQADWQLIKKYCKEDQTPPLDVFLAEAENGESMWYMNLVSPLALIIGSEARGSGAEAQNLADKRICIPMPGKFESLNAGVAASLLLYEVIRQRSSHTVPN